MIPSVQCCRMTDLEGFDINYDNTLDSMEYIRYLNHNDCNVDWTDMLPSSTSYERQQFDLYSECSCQENDSCCPVIPIDEDACIVMDFVIDNCQKITSKDETNNKEDDPSSCQGGIVCNQWMLIGGGAAAVALLITTIALGLMRRNQLVRRDRATIMNNESNKPYPLQQTDQHAEQTSSSSQDDDPHHNLDDDDDDDDNSPRLSARFGQLLTSLEQQNSTSPMTSDKGRVSLSFSPSSSSPAHHVFDDECSSVEHSVTTTQSSLVLHLQGTLEDDDQAGLETDDDISPPRHVSSFTVQQLDI